jgi:hypothetical protein
MADASATKLSLIVANPRPYAPSARRIAPPTAAPLLTAATIALAAFNSRPKRQKHPCVNGPQKSVQSKPRPGALYRLKPLILAANQLGSHTK